MIFFCISFSYTFKPYKLSLNAKDLEKIQHSPKKNFIIKRFKQYIQMTKKVKDYPTFKKLSHVNTFFNRILPQNDKAKYGMDDYWTTQKEFLFKGKGDCEDYAISKYFTLLELGIPKEQLFLSVVQVKGKQTDHMVLLYIKYPNAIPLVMDNLSFKVVPLNKRKKLIQKLAFNELGSYKIYDNRLQEKVKINWGKEDKWATILKRVYENNE
jgi:predicted transglutaminase-like cysteine proteinase